VKETLLSELIDAAGIAARINRSVDTVRYWDRTGTGGLPKSAKFGRRRVWKRAEIEAWIDEQFAKAGV
jgi:predicted DNA-binding transcriptional regulator AlpA